MQDQMHEILMIKRRYLHLHNLFSLVGITPRGKLPHMLYKNMLARPIYVFMSL